MPELRTDWLTGRTVIVAANRAFRPNEFEAQEAAAAAGNESCAACPFCPGQESLTPPEVYTQNDAEGHWQIRVVPNKFPAFAHEADPVVPPAELAVGVHEVIIESARHVDRMTSLSRDELGSVVTAYRERLDHWHGDGRFKYGLIFKNLGAKAGASLAHLHGQLIALSELPPAVAAEHERAQQFLREGKTCVYCDLIERERAAEERIVLDLGDLIAFCPYASLQPHEVWIMPTGHEPWFERGSPAVARRLGDALGIVLGMMEQVIPRFAYNLLIRTSPWENEAACAGHWRIEILPRVNAFAGLELATGIHINPKSPTRAAQELRSA